MKYLALHQKTQNSFKPYKNLSRVFPDSGTRTVTIYPATENGLSNLLEEASCFNAKIVKLGADRFFNGEYLIDFVEKEIEAGNYKDVFKKRTMEEVA